MAKIGDCPVCSNPILYKGTGRKPDVCSPRCRKRKQRLMEKWGIHWRDHVPGRQRSVTKGDKNTGNVPKVDRTCPECKNQNVPVNALKNVCCPDCNALWDNVYAFKLNQQGIPGYKPDREGVVTK